MAFNFNYNKFYTYYTDKNNYNEAPTQPILFYYNNDKNSKNRIQSNTSQNYILIGNERVYISKIGNNGLLFTIPTTKYGKQYDFHYHFGIREPNTDEKKYEIDDYVTLDSSRSSESNSPNMKHSNTQKTKTNIVNTTQPSHLDEVTEKDFTFTKIKINPNEKLIYFHKTIQKPDDPINLTGTNEHNRCYFQNNIKIKKLKYILCTNESQRYMENKFSKEELHEIYEIISRPFLDDIMNNIHNNKKKVKKTKSKSRKHIKTFRKHIKQSGIIIQDVVNSEIREIFRK